MRAVPFIYKAIALLKHGYQKQKNYGYQHFFRDETAIMILYWQETKLSYNGLESRSFGIQKKVIKVLGTNSSFV